jgi:ABC-2 type transport system permease protein
MRERVFEIIRKELKQTLRDPRRRTLVFVPPIMQMLIFGYAVNLDVEHVKIAWMDQDRSSESRELLERFTSGPTFSVVAGARSEAEASAILDRGDAQAVIRVRAGYEREIRSGGTAEVQILLDGTDSNTASIIGNYAGSVISSLNRSLLEKRQREKLVGRTQAGPVLLRIPSVAPETRIWFNSDLRSRNYFVPGVLVNIIMLVTLMLTALSVVREKEIGTMEQIMVTPIRPLELILGKTIPFGLLGFIDMALITGIALVVFHVPLRGSFMLLIVCALLFLLSTLGMGLFISTICDTQQQAMMSTFFFFQPAFMLSGFAFPIRNMPEVVQWLTYLNPMRYFMEIVRGVFLKGIGAEILWPQMLCLTIFGAVVLGSSAVRFRKRLD